MMDGDRGDDDSIGSIPNLDGKALDPTMPYKGGEEKQIAQCHRPRKRPVLVVFGEGFSEFLLKDWLGNPGNFVQRGGRKEIRRGSKFRKCRGRKLFFAKIEKMKVSKT